MLGEQQDGGVQAERAEGLHADTTTQSAEDQRTPSWNSVMRSTHAAAARTTSATRDRGAEPEDLPAGAPAAGAASTASDPTAKAAAPMATDGDGDAHERADQAPVRSSLPRLPPQDQEQRARVEERGDRRAEREAAIAHHAHQQRCSAPRSRAPWRR